jgi:energy-coupling factor transporter ATP-binding protein EcfA2
VDNDVEVGPAGTFLLVTGSNMSGKSTLLRAIGVNLVLAGAGGPVCARSFRAPPVTLWTSMRVQDSLERGVSYFMAELQRLKAVVDAARGSRGLGVGDRKPERRSPDPQPPAANPQLRRAPHCCCETGTNTAERRCGAADRRVSAGCGAVGAVSTHDLTLADALALAERAMVHLVETFVDGAGHR